MTPMFYFILAIFMLLLGLVTLFGKNPLSAMFGKPLSMILGVALVVGAIWLIIVFQPFGGVSTAQAVGSAGVPAVSGSVLGTLDVKLHDGVVNDTYTTSDYYNDDKDFITFYAVDANLEDGQEIKYNATIERTSVTYAGSVKVLCTIPDKEISGVTADNIAEKTSGQVDLDINDGGNFENDNSVYKTITFAEGTATAEVEIAFDHEETYHDGMTDLDDYVDMSCSAQGEKGESVSWTARVLANG